MRYLLKTADLMAGPFTSLRRIGTIQWARYFTLCAVFGIR